MHAYMQQTYTPYHNLLYTVGRIGLDLTQICVFTEPYRYLRQENTYSF